MWGGFLKFNYITATSSIRHCSHHCKIDLSVDFNHRLKKQKSKEHFKFYLENLIRNKRDCLFLTEHTPGKD